MSDLRPLDVVPVLADGPVVAASFTWQVFPPQPALVLVAKSTLSIVSGQAARPRADQPTARWSSPSPSRWS